MTTPHSGPDDLDNNPDAANTQGIAGLQGQSGADGLQGRMNGIGGPLGSIASWMLGGLAGTVIDNAEAATTTSTSKSMENAAGFVAGHMQSTSANTTSELGSLLSSLTGTGLSNWNSLAKIITGFLPAMLKLILGPLGALLETGTSDDIDGDTSSSLLSNIPVIGPLVQSITTLASGTMSTLSSWFSAFTSASSGFDPGTGSTVTDAINNIHLFNAATANTATVAASSADNANTVGSSAQAIANQALALVQGVVTGGVSATEHFSGTGSLDSAKFDTASAISGTSIGVVSGELTTVTSASTSFGTYNMWALYKATLFHADDQSTTIVVGNNGNTSYPTLALTRCDATLTKFVYVAVYPNKVTMGYGTRSGTTWSLTQWASYTTTVSAGYSIGLRSVGAVHTVSINGTDVGALTYTDTAGAAFKGASYRQAAVKLTYDYGVFTGDRYSFNIRSMSMSDVAA